MYINFDKKDGSLCALGVALIVYLLFYPTALKDCRGIIFTHGVQMGGQAGAKKSVRAVSKKS